MHENNTEILQKETSRLLSNFQTILEDFSKNKANEGEIDDSELSTINEIQNILAEEEKKVEAMELVVAITGVMKAGKSTTINAIVGTEVVPNRNQPMTALPTLIRHTPGQTEPHLTFQNPKPIENTIQQIQSCLQAPPESADLDQFLEQPYGNNLKEAIQKGHLKGSDFNAQGSEAIAEKLERINDLIRLARLLEIDFPYNEFSSLHNFPLIEVEFVHLPEEPETQFGTFSLLDTPGPNEAQHSEVLTQIMQEQLNQSSALLLVTDYTDQGSEADSQVSSIVQNIFKGPEDYNRLYVLVNKYDQKQGNDQETDDQLKEHISNKMSFQQSSLPTDQIYPVSARKAFLANAALRALENGASLTEHSWKEDFGKIAFGETYEDEDLSDKQEVQKKAKKIIEISNFQEPLNNSIRYAFQKTPLLTLKSALDKLSEHGFDIEQKLELQRKGLEKSTQELEKDINDLENDKNNITDLENELDSSLQKRIQTIGQEIDDETTKAKKKLQDDILELFETSKQKEEDKQKQLEKSPNIFERFLQEIRQESPTPDNDGHEEIDKTIKEGTQKGSTIEFDEQSVAQQLLKDMQETIERKTSDVNESLIQSIEKSIEQHEAQIRSTIAEKADPLFENIQKRMNESGYDLNNIHPPEFGSPEIEARLGSKIGEKGVKSKQKTIKRDKDSVWGATARVFGSLFGQDDWGKESVQRDYYVVDLDQQLDNAQEAANEYFNDLEKGLQKYFQNNLQEKQNKYFKYLRNMLENMREDLLRSMKEKRESLEKQDMIVHFLEALQKKAKDELDAQQNVKDELRHLEY